MAEGEDFVRIQQSFTHIHISLVYTLILAICTDAEG